MINALSTVVKKLFFFDHGSRLLRPGAANWLLSVWFLAVAMALLEGFTWAKILMLFLPPEYEKAAVAVGVCWGVGIWIIDASFATLDTARDYRARTDAAATRATGWRVWFTNRMLMGSLIRVCIITFSMALTGPFLAKTLDERKLVQQIAAQNTQAVATSREQLASRASTKIQSLEAEIAKQRQDLVKETAGKGISGKGGRGPVATAIDANIAQLEQSLRQSRSDAATELNDVDRSTPEGLARKYGIKLLADNADTRAQLQKERPAGNVETIFGFPASHVIASSLFVLLFLVMLVLKIYQPRSVTIYLNDFLQEEYERYSNGGFASLPATILDPLDHHDGPTPMGAQRFDIWYHEWYLPNQQAIQLGRERQAEQDMLNSELSRLKSGCDATRIRVEGFAADLVAAIDQKGRLADQLASDESGLAKLEKQVMQTEAQIKHTYLNNLAARRFDSDKKRQEATDRLAVIGMALAKELPGQLDEAVRDIQQSLRRHGILSDTPPPGLAQTDPMLATQLERRDQLMAQRHDLEVERVAMTTVVEQLDAEITVLNERLTAGINIEEGPAGANDPSLSVFWEQRWSLTQAIADLQTRIAKGNDRLDDAQRQVAMLKGRLQQETAALDELQTAAREKQVTLSMMPSGRACAAA